jgi:hypothetical protein
MDAFTLVVLGTILFFKLIIPIMIIGFIIWLCVEFAGFIFKTIGFGLLFIFFVIFIFMSLV